MPELIQQLLQTLLAAHKKPFEEAPDAAPTGSRVICTPPTLDTDDDWLVFVPESLQALAIEWLEAHGATHSPEQESYPDGVCYRYGNLNPILIWDWGKFYQWVAATWVAQKVNPRDKAARTEIFAVLVDMTGSVEKLKLPPYRAQLD